MKTFYHITTGNPAVFADNEDIANWPEYSETLVIDSDTLAAEVREERDALLDTTDKEILKIFDTATSWTNLETLRSDWKTYRQALRDITDQAGFPNEVTWPTKPEGAN